MNKQAWLLVNILAESGEERTVGSTLIDGTDFTIKVHRRLLDPIVAKGKPTRGWLRVEWHGTAQRKASITLPAPIINHGPRITVDNGKIKP